MNERVEGTENDLMSPARGVRLMLLTEMWHSPLQAK